MSALLRISEAELPALLRISILNRENAGLSQRKGLHRCRANSAKLRQSRPCAETSTPKPRTCVNPLPTLLELAARVTQDRCRANSAQIRQSRPDSGLGPEVKVRKTFRVIPSSLDSGCNRPPTRQIKTNARGQHPKQAGYEPSFRLGPPRPQTVGCVGGCDQEEGEIECPCRQRLSRSGERKTPLHRSRHCRVIQRSMIRVLGGGLCPSLVKSGPQSTKRLRRRP